MEFAADVPRLPNQDESSNLTTVGKKRRGKKYGHMLLVNFRIPFFAVKRFSFMKTFALSFYRLYVYPDSDIFYSRLSHR